jgi:RNA polymerase sigma factor (TIGR02999 family)
MQQVYDSLRKLAHHRLACERAGHTLQATALVHEVFLKLKQESPGEWSDVAHYYNVAANAMRQILIDHARSRDRVKRGEGRVRVPLTEVMDVATLADDVAPADILALDQAVTDLEHVNASAAAVVRLRFYAGLTVAETAKSLGIGERTVKEKWAYAKAWLFDRLSDRGS